MGQTLALRLGISDSTWEHFVYLGAFIHFRLTSSSLNP